MDHSSSMATKYHLAIICIGSNFSSEENVSRAVHEIKQLFEMHIQFASSIYTESIGMATPSTFLNIVGIGKTPHTYETMRSKLKQLEKDMGRKKEYKRKGIVPIDIDILQWDDQVLKPIDMNYPFVKESLRSLSKNAE